MEHQDLVSRRALAGEDLQTVYRNELRLLKLANALLGVSRIEVGRMRASYEPIDLGRITLETASAFRSAVERADLEFVITIDPVSKPVYIDRGMWEHIVLTLLSNAVKFTLHGGVELLLRDRDESVELNVRDTGSGIAEEHLPHVFERFHWIDRAEARTQEGSGISLALVDELVRLHGGTVRVSSVVGEGSTFSVTLPKGAAQECEERIRRLVDSNIIGIVIWHTDGRVIDTNDEFLRMIGFDRADLLSGRLRWTDLTPAEWRDREVRALVELKDGGTVQAHEREFLRRDGTRVPVLAGGAIFEGSEHEGVAFVLDLTERKQQERKISALNDRLIAAQEQERIRLARELHDGVMQEMLAVTMMLGTAKRALPDGSAPKVTIDAVQERLIRVGTDLRRLSHDLYPPFLDEVGLPRAVQTYCEQFSAASGIPISCEADENAGVVSQGAALALFRIVQEALGNAVKHAHANRVSVRVTRTGDHVSLVVSDDGVGFDRSRLDTERGLGLITMRDRATQLAGHFECESAPGAGTAIRVLIPTASSRDN